MWSSGRCGGIARAPLPSVSVYRAAHSATRTAHKHGTAQRRQGAKGPKHVNLAHSTQHKEGPAEQAAGSRQNNGGARDLHGPAAPCLLHPCPRLRTFLSADGGGVVLVAALARPATELVIMAPLVAGHAARLRFVHRAPTPRSSRRGSQAAHRHGGPAQASSTRARRTLAGHADTAGPGRGPRARASEDFGMQAAGRRVPTREPQVNFEDCKSSACAAVQPREVQPYFFQIWPKVKKACFW